LWASIVEAPQRYNEIVTPWERTDVDLSAAKRIVTNTWRKARIEPEQLSSTPVCWYKIDYNEIENSNLDANLSLKVDRSGTAHGFAIWFDSELTDNIGFSNNPNQPELIYGHAFFPFPDRVELERGDRIELSLKAALIRGDYVWRWDTTVVAAGTSQPRASFRQSTLHGVPLSPTHLHKQAATYKPTLTEQGQIRRFIMESMTGNNSLEEIATRLAKQFPGRYADWRSALDDVTVVSLEFGK
jgi:hypothetical protein